MDDPLFTDKIWQKTHPDPASKSARVLVDIDLAAAVARGAMARRIAADNSAMVAVVFVLLMDAFRFSYSFIAFTRLSFPGRNETSHVTLSA